MLKLTYAYAGTCFTSGAGKEPVNGYTITYKHETLLVETTPKACIFNAYVVY